MDMLFGPETLGDFIWPKSSRSLLSDGIKTHFYNWRLSKKDENVFLGFGNLASINGPIFVAKSYRVATTLD